MAKSTKAPHYTMTQLTEIAMQHDKQIRETVTHLNEKQAEYEAQIRELEQADENIDFESIDAILGNSNKINEIKAKIDTIIKLKKKAQAQPYNVSEDDFAAAWEDVKAEYEERVLEASRKYYTALMQAKEAASDYWDLRMACIQKGHEVDQIHKMMNLHNVSSHIMEYPELPAPDHIIFKKTYHSNFSPSTFNGIDINRG